MNASLKVWTVAVVGMSWWSVGAAAETEPAQAQILERLDRLEQQQAETARESRQKDAQIGKLESELALERKANDAQPSPLLTLQPNGGGFKVADTPMGDLNISI